MGLSSYRDFFLHSEETNHGDHPFIIMMKSENLWVSAESTQYIGHILQRLIVFLYLWDRLHIHEESFRKRFAFFSFLSLSVPSFTFFKRRSEKENHQTLFESIGKSLSLIPFLKKLCYLRTSDFPPAFLAKLKSFLFELYYEWY